MIVQNNRRGFTLPEMLVVLAIFCIISVTIFTSFRTLMHSYEQGSAVIRIAENARAALRDMTNSFQGTTVLNPPYLKSYSNYDAILNTTSLATAAYALNLNGYSWDSIEFTMGLTTSTTIYFVDTLRELIKVTNNIQEPLAFGVTNLNFLFYPRDTTYWVTHWDTMTTLPRSIYMAVTIQDEKKEVEPHTFTTLVTLP
jgi:prepilin-type N-terminal cleavage/methylation domain-containing protein